MTESKECDSIKDEDILKLIESVEFGRVIVFREKGKTVLTEDAHTRKPKDFALEPPPLPDPEKRPSVACG